jgi:glycosyltransferase involved in cell wall biosynthesis
MSRVLLDGWSLVFEPASPAALHTWSLLAWRPTEVELFLALPGERPVWLPTSVQSIHRKTENKPWKHLAWEQGELIRLGNDLKADFVHTTSQTAPLFSRLACTNSPAYFPGKSHLNPMTERLRLATGQGGLSTTQAQLWPADLPLSAPNQIACPPFVHPEFSVSPSPKEISTAELPETFVLYHGPNNEADLRRLLSAWGWAAGPIGSSYPLLLTGQNAVARDFSWMLIKEFQATDSVQILPEVPIPSIPAVYQRCTVLFHPAEISPWGDPVLHAMAVGKPIAAAATAWASSRLGQAAYLAPLDDARALGAALITLVIEEDMAEKLGQAALQRSNTWNSATIQATLANLWKI